MKILPTKDHGKTRKDIGITFQIGGLSSGDRYEGQWEDDKSNGKGIYFEKKGLREWSITMQTGRQKKEYKHKWDIKDGNDGQYFYDEHLYK